MKSLRNTIKLFLFAGTISVFSGCSDFLDQRPQGQWTMDDIEGGAYFSKVMSLYDQSRNYNITAGIPAFAFHYFRSEDACKGSTLNDGAEHIPMWDNFQYSAGNSLLNAYWNKNYDIINEANTIIDEINAAIEDGVQVDEDVRMCASEAHFFRAWCYFNLVRAWGEVPLVNFTIKSADEANIAKSSVAEIYAQIDKDLKDAENLPMKWENRYIGRITSGAVRALHAKTYAQRRMWGEMYQYSKMVMESNQYDLKTPFDKIFRESYENCSESVWEIQCTATAAESSNSTGSQFVQVQGCRGSNESDLGWGWNMVTMDCYNAFETGDPRRDETLLYFSTPSSPWPSFAPTTGNAPYNEFLVSQDGLHGSFYNKKAYCDPKLREQYNDRQGHWYNIRMIRYSDVVLMAAEAACELGGEKNIAEALDLLEQVRGRARAGKDVLPKVTTTDQTELRKAIHHERHVELAMEPDRFYDLVRWNEAVDVLGPLGYQDKNKFLPLPQKQIDASNGVLVQNPDYAG